MDIIEKIEKNRNYGFIFGLESSKGEFLFYEGNDKWRAVFVKSETKINENTTKKVLDFLASESVF